MFISLASDNKELGAIDGNKPISRQTSPFSRPSSVAIMKSLAKTLTEQVQQRTDRLIQCINTLKDQAVTINSIIVFIDHRLTPMLDWRD